jgi:hypothetical protein
MGTVWIDGGARDDDPTQVTLRIALAGASFSAAAVEQLHLGSRGSRFIPAGRDGQRRIAGPGIRKSARVVMKRPIAGSTRH